MFELDALRDQGFSWKAAFSLAVACKLAYEPGATVKSTAINSWRFSSASFLDIGDTQGFIAEADGVLLIAFRGSESLGDWISNMDIALTPFGNFGLVHSGFLRSYEAVRSQVITAAQAAQTKNEAIWLTGHSLGGALAGLAAADLSLLGLTPGVHTFGQPRLCDEAFRSYIENNYRDRYFRFVNHQDIVTRIPPGFQTFGTCLHFDGNGAVQASESALAAEDPPLSEAEFARLQHDIRRLNAPSVEGGIPYRGALEPSLEGLFPEISDHYLDRYIAAVRRYATGANTDSALQSGEVEVAFDRAIQRKAIAFDGDEIVDGERLPVLVRLRDANWEPKLNIIVNSKFGNFASLEVTSHQLKWLEQDPEILAIEASREAGNLELQSSIPFIHGDVVHRPPISENGDAALIGIIDTGVDVLHEAFRAPDGTSRILAYWDQTAQGRSPSSVAPEYFRQTYGTLYLKSEIDQFIAGRLSVPASLRDPLGHGTHVASIAGGRATGRLADGMAPGASFIVVAGRIRSAAGAPRSLGYSNSHVDAVAFLRSAAGGDIPGAQASNPIASAWKPIAINISQGMNAGAHDGSSTLEAAFDALSGGGRDAGVVIVKSAGNERGYAGHARIRAFNGVETIKWNSIDTLPKRKKDYFELWYSSLDDLEFTLIDPAGKSSGAVTNASPNSITVLGGNNCELRLTRYHPDNGANRLAIIISEAASSIQSGEWVLKVTGTSVLSGDGEVDIWAERDDTRPVRFLVEEPRGTLSIPGTALTVITVGACSPQLPLQLTTSSSYGRTRDNRPKPDICAPGNRILAAGSNGGPQDTAVMTGTSMAAPHVTGAIALVMSAREKLGQTSLNARQIQPLLVRTAMSRAPFHHEGFGFGILDAEAFFNNAIAAV